MIVVGETAKVKVRNAVIDVTVKTITSESVVVITEDKTLELNLAER